MVADAMASVGVLQSEKSWPKLCKEIGVDNDLAARVRPDGWGLDPETNALCIFEAEWSNSLSVEKVDAYDQMDAVECIYLFTVDKWGRCCVLSPMLAIMRYNELLDVGFAAKKSNKTAYKPAKRADGPKTTDCMP